MLSFATAAYGARRTAAAAGVPGATSSGVPSRHASPTSASEVSPSPTNRSVSARPGSLCSSLVTGGETYGRHSHGSASANTSPSPGAHAHAGTGAGARAGAGATTRAADAADASRRSAVGSGRGSVVPGGDEAEATLVLIAGPAAPDWGVRTYPPRNSLAGSARDPGASVSGVAAGAPEAASGESSPGVGPGAPAGGRRSIDARDDESSVQPRGATD